MSIYIVKRNDDHLEHHGIKGQKWGVQNGPPYPLTNSAKSASERKNNSAKSSSEKKLNSNVTGMSADDQVALIQLSTLAVLATAVALAPALAERRLTKEYDRKYYDTRDINSLAEAPRIDPKSMSMDDHMKAINPDYPKPGSTQNCMFCTTAMAMRMKGYDVKANKCPSGWTTNNLKDNFKDSKPINFKPISANHTIRDVEKEILSQGEGAYGNYCVSWPYGGGHSMFYHVEKGKVVIYDTQANKKRTISECYKAGGTPRDCVRLDNVEPTERVLGTLRKV